MDGGKKGAGRVTISRGPAALLMARDAENLAAAARDGRARFEAYHFDPAAVTAGRNARVADEEIARWRLLGHEFARRPTGGGILRHGDDLAFGVALPLHHDGAPLATASTIGRVSAVIRAALAEFGVETAPAGAAATAPAQCFAAPIGAELVYRGEKILGLAARRVRGAILVQGALAVRRNPDRDRLVVGAGPKVDLQGTAFDGERFVARLSALIADG